LWKVGVLGPVVQKADAAGIQCAVHAIGDAAITMAIDAIEHNTSPGHRHRIEHIELSSPEDAKRLGRLGITASIQPVHSDPAILRAWRNILGEDRLKRAFAYREFHDHGSPLAIGTDAPTAPHFPFANAYVATTRKSAKEPHQGDEPVNPEFTISLIEAMVGATYGVAYSVFAEKRVGSLSAGKLADFIVVDYDVERNEDSERLRNAKVLQTWFAGRLVYEDVK
jgi:predicted amidohydrolase YtcJ